MKKTLLLLTTALFSVGAMAQTEIKIGDIDKHIGDSVKICAKVTGGVFLSRNESLLTFINVGGDYPNAPLTLVIRPLVRKTYTGEENPETFYKGKDVCIYGRLSVYKGKTQIEVHDKAQIVLAK